MPRFEYLWRSKYLCDNCQSIDDIIDRLQAEVKFLQEMKADGVQLDADSSQDDYFTLTTDCPEVAIKYEFDVVEDGDEEDEDDDWDDDDEDWDDEEDLYDDEDDYLDEDDHDLLDRDTNDL